MSGLYVRGMTAVFLISLFTCPSIFSQFNEIEPNQTCTEAQNIDWDSWDMLPLDILGEVSQDPGSDPTGDVDFFYFQGPAGMRLRAELKAEVSPSGINWEPSVGLFDTNCSLIAQGTHRYQYPARSHLLDFVVPADGRFVLAATGCCDVLFRGQHTEEGAYSLMLLYTPVPIGGITGRLVDSVTGAPLGGDPPTSAHVNLYRCFEENCEHWVDARSPDEFGSFRFEEALGFPLDPGAYLLTVTSATHQPRDFGPFEVLALEVLDLGELAIEPPPFVFENVVPCSDIPAGGGECWFSVDVRNHTDLPLSGQGWSMVTVFASRLHPYWLSEFAAQRTRSIQVPAHGSATLRFHFSVPAGVGEGRLMSVMVFVSDRADGYFKPLQLLPIFAISKEGPTFDVLDGEAAAALMGTKPTPPGRRCER